MYPGSRSYALLFGKILFPLALLCLTFCKSQNQDSSSVAVAPVAACSQPPCSEQEIATAKAACLKIVGAQWTDATNSCQIPSNLKMCQSVKKDYVWDGEQCVAGATAKNYYRWCIDTTASDAIKATLATIAKDFNGSNCQSMNFALKNRTQIAYEDANLVDLTPFQAFTGLKSLDLWNNKIQDLSPLANLTQLETLNLGHNLIIDLKPLAGLKKLKELMLFENSISDLSPLFGLTSLQTLDLRTNPVSSFAGLERVTDLRKDAPGTGVVAPPPTTSGPVATTAPVVPIESLMDTTVTTAPSLSSVVKHPVTSTLSKTSVTTSTAIH